MTKDEWLQKAGSQPGWRPLRTGLGDAGNDRYYVLVYAPDGLIAPFPKGTPYVFSVDGVTWSATKTNGRYMVIQELSPLSVAQNVAHYIMEDE